MNLLFFGFSVTEAKESFARQAKAKLETQGHAVDVCGLGGIHPDHAAYILPLVLGRKKYDRVILEVFTSAYRGSSRSSDDYHWPLWYMAQTCLQHGAVPVFLLLFRADVSIGNDEFADAGTRVAERLSVPLIDLRSALQPFAGDSRFLKDAVHPTDAGTEKYIERLFPALGNITGNFAPVYPTSATPTARLNTIEIPEACKSSNISIPYSDHIRPGINFRHAIITPNRPLTIDFGVVMQINGIGYLMGPRSGFLRIQSDDEKTLDLLAYDDYCYYERFHARLFPSFQSRRLKFEVPPEVPEISLRKGEKDLGERVAKLCHLYCTTEPFESILDTARLGWSAAPSSQ